MQRLLQGDVGSGKTVVALYALLRAVEAGYRGAFMAPTETLAEQHFLTVEELCRQIGVSVGLLTSSVPKGQRDTGASILVGTHALIQEGVDLTDLAVAVIDEQHRFGVEQRKALAEGRIAHTLHMTATPIPRTLALTVYGDLAVSEITHPPAGRKPVITRWVGQDRSAEAYRRLRGTSRREPGLRHLSAHHRVGDDRGARGRGGDRAAAARRAARPARRVPARTARPAERRELMGRFKARELDVLVATTVIEVGVDVPNATIMIVQEADRFGLAQLHQLRGRVGRGPSSPTACSSRAPREELTESALSRLEALVRTTDGFELAEADLEIRGEGQLLGTRQSGLSDLAFTKLRADRALSSARARLPEGSSTTKGRWTTRSSGCSATQTLPPSRWRSPRRSSASATSC